jgi:hypothetical protein
MGLFLCEELRGEIWMARVIRFLGQQIFELGDGGNWHLDIYQCEFSSYRLGGRGSHQEDER